MTEPGATGDGTSPHETCEVCRTIPDVAVSTTRGETTSGTPLPPAVGRLVVVGAPYFDDDMSSSNRALHRCPVCGTFYDWTFEYEYLAGGSEDTTTFRRLSREEGERRERECLAEVEAAALRAEETAREHVAALVRSAERETVDPAARFFNAARRRGFDPGFGEAVPAVVGRIARVSEADRKGIFVYDLRDLVLPWAARSPERARRVLGLLAECGVAEPSAEARELAAACERILAASGAVSP